MFYLLAVSFAHRLLSCFLLQPSPLTRPMNWTLHSSSTAVKPVTVSSLHIGIWIHIKSCTVIETSCCYGNNWLADQLQVQLFCFLSCCEGPHNVFGHWGHTMLLIVNTVGTCVLWPVTRWRGWSLRSWSWQEVCAACSRNWLNWRQSYRN